jgi:hypothetical protein
MHTYVRDGQKRKWHMARTMPGRAMLPGEYTNTLCNRHIKAREFTPDIQDTHRTGLCYQCGRKEDHG